MQRLYGSDDLFPDTPRAMPTGPSRASTSSPPTTASASTTWCPTTRSTTRPNGHGNTDGTDDNRSWNCGWEGDEGVPGAVLALRQRQVKNFCALLMLANGMPMFVRRRRVPATRSAATTTPTTRTTRPPGSTGIGCDRTATCSASSKRHDRLPQGAPIPRAQPVLARRCALVRRRPGGRSGRLSRTAWPIASTGRAAATRPLRDDQRLLGRPRVHRAGGPAAASGDGWSTRRCPAPPILPSRARR